MKFSILIPHWKTPRMTAYIVRQFLKYKGRHDVNIIVIDNSFPDDSIKELDSLREEVMILPNDSHLLSSHGIALDMAIEIAESEWVITAESDSFPTKDNWLDYYVRLINDGYDGAASLLHLSGGTYGHPAGALYRRNIWVEAWKYCREIEYAYFPNISMRDAFQCHAMIHKSILKDFLDAPEDYIELSDSYKPYSKRLAQDKRHHYSRVVNPFHNGMGSQNESIRTYGLRNKETEVPAILLDNKKKILNRVGYEPGQWLYYWQLAKGYKIFEIPTEVKWVPGREGQQQEYTLMENGFKHIWAGSAYLDMKESDPFMYEFKQKQIEQLIQF